MQTILILHNTFGSPSDELYLSRAGVMDQVNAVADALIMLGYKYEIVAVPDLRELVKLLASRKEKTVFNLIEEFIGDIEQACYVPVLCKAYGKQCTGNGTPAILLAQNKIRSKAVLAHYNLRCPQGAVLPAGDISPLEQLPAGKYILKPACCDASEGITMDSIIELPDGLGKAQALAKNLFAQFGQSIVVEQYIPAGELNVSVVQIKSRPKVVAVAEIDFSAFKGDMFKIVDYDAKWKPDTFGYNNTPRKIPAKLAPEVYKQVCDMSLAAWRAIGCRGYARVDFRLDEDGTPYILEVNPNPDISPDAGFAAALDYAGIAYDQFVWNMINDSI